MRNEMAQHPNDRHPVIAGIVLLVLAPYVLAFVLVFGAAAAAAVLIDWLDGRR